MFDLKVGILEFCASSFGRESSFLGSPELKLLQEDFDYLGYTKIDLDLDISR